MDAELHLAIELFDVARFLEKHHVSKNNGTEYILTCPTCGKDKLTINAEKRAWHCWVCDERGGKGRGGLLDAIAILEGCDKYAAAQIVLAQARPLIGGLARIDADLMQEYLQEYSEAQQIPAPPFWEPIQEELHYLHIRGITMNDVLHYSLGVCRQGPYAGRLIFPIFERGVLVYYQGRAMWNTAKDEVKALNPPKGTPTISTDVLFNIEGAARFERVAITEGPIDAIHTGPDAVCTFGKRLAPRQIAKLLKYGVRKVDIVWDADAWTEAVKTARNIRPLFESVRLVEIPQGTDPGAMSREAIDAYRLRAQEVSSALEVL